MPPRTKAIAAVLALFLIWTAGTWYLEGRIDTLLRPDAVLDRLLYAVLINQAVGMAGTVFVLRRVFGWRAGDRQSSGFGSRRRTAAAVVAGLLLGLGFYAAAGGATSDPVVIANAFAQVFVVSAAEVLVCWAAVASVLESGLRPLGKWLAIGIAAIVASALFGLYHFAHSAPFNSWAMVAFLSAVGLVTSAFFFVSRDVYGTIVFHNFMGVLGVTNALAESGQLASLETLQIPLFVTAAATILLLTALDRYWLRHGT